jgi:hypothetical protein
MNELKNEKKVYATIFDDDGIDYRMISKLMTDVGWTVNHTSCRNYVLRIMNKFAEAFAEFYNIEPSEATLDRISKDARFQSAISELLQTAFYSNEKV